MLTEFTRSSFLKLNFLSRRFAQKTQKIRRNSFGINCFLRVYKFSLVHKPIRSHRDLCGFSASSAQICGKYYCKIKARQRI